MSNPALSWSLDDVLSDWAEFIRGGRVMRSYGQSVLAKFTDQSFAGSYGSRMPGRDTTICEDVEILVQRLHSLNPRQALVLRTEYGLTRFYDVRGQLYRAAKADIPLRSYEYALAQARKKIREWLAELWFDS